MDRCQALKCTYADNSAPEKLSIAVLPFDNMSGDAEQEYFADGESSHAYGERTMRRG